MIYIFKYKIFRYIFLSNLPALNISPHPRNKTRLAGNLEVETLTQNVNVTLSVSLVTFPAIQICFLEKKGVFICAKLVKIFDTIETDLEGSFLNWGETLLRSGLTMHKEASLKTHVSLSHYLNQQRESLETLLIYLSSAPSPPPVPHPPVSSQNFRKGRTPIRVRLYQFNLRNIPPWSCSAIYGVEYGFWMCLNTV